MLLLAGAEILGGYIDDTVCIDIKCYLNLRNASSCRRNPIQTELAEGLVVPCKLALTLQDVNVNCGLVVSRRREDLALLCRDRRVSLNQPCGDTAHRLDGQ